MRARSLIASLAISLTAAAALAAPANACFVAGPTLTYYSDTSEITPEPGEVVLEVRFIRREPFSAPPYYGWGNKDDSRTDRLDVVRVVQGDFDGDTILIPVRFLCSYVTATPPTGRETGLVVGFVTPPAPDWTDAPAMAARSRTLDDPLSADEFLKLALEQLPKFTYAGAPAGPPPSLVRAPVHIDPTEKPSELLLRAIRARDPVVRKELTEAALAILMPRADQGDTSAMIEISDVMRARAPSYAPGAEPQGDGYKIYSHLYWLERAASLGDARAMYRLGEHFDGLNRDRLEQRETATDWLRKSAEAGHACAMGKLALRYLQGRGTAVDKDQAVVWYRRAIGAGAIMSAYGFELDGDPPADHNVSTLQCPAGEDRW